MIHIKLNSKKINISVKNPGILEVPEGKKVTSLNKSHIEGLVKKKGRAKISRSVTNLKVWNKNKRTESANEIRAWANKALKWIDNFSGKTNASSIVSNSINTCISIKSGVNSGDFFKNYSQVIRKPQGLLRG